MDLSKYIKSVKGFPKPGVVFRDFSPLIRTPKSMKYACEQIIERYKDENVIWGGIDARGFVFSSYIAGLRNEGIVLIRKSGKLPNPVIEASYDLEYGTEKLSVNKAVSKLPLVLIDDVLATGGTLKTAEKICVKAGYNVIGASVLIKLEHLCPKEYKIAGRPVNYLIKY